MMPALHDRRNRQALETHVVIIALLIVVLAAIQLGDFSVVEHASADDGSIKNPDDSALTIGEIGGYLYGETSATRRVYVERRFTDPGGKGFAAEEANNFIDRLKGIDARVEGYDLAANGPDRKIVNRDGSTTWIQDKYHAKASDSVRDAFDSETRQYRYIKDGKPMQLEVPADQYDEAVKLMEERIKEGRVPGVADPVEAEKIVRKGSLTFDQAVKLAEPGTIPSLKYDAARGTVSSTCAFGITFGIGFLLCLHEGLSVGEAASEAAKSGALGGSAVFASELITSQLMKTGAKEAMAPASDAVARWLGEDACKALLASAKENTANLTSKQLAERASKVLRSQAVFNVVITAVLTVPDAIDLAKGRISKEQFIKNFAVVVAGIAGAEAGALAGTAIIKIPVLGTAAGKVIGGLIGAGAGIALADVIANQFFKDDSDKMYEILTKRFGEHCEEYVVGSAEAEAIAEKLNGELTTDVLKDMFAAEDREAYADGLMVPIFEDAVQNRTYEDVPSDYEVRMALLGNLQDVVFIH